MGKRHLAKIEEVLPKVAADPEVQDAAEALEQAEDLAGVMRTKGGDAIVAFLLAECVNALAWLRQNYATAEHKELLAHLSRYDAHYSLLESMKKGDQITAELQAELDQLVMNKQME